MSKIEASQFTFSDAWVFASLIRLGNSGQLDLSDLIAIGDGLNHAILMAKEIKQGLIKCQKWGLVKIDNRRYTLTNRARTICQELSKTRGGLFSVIDNTLAKLNSKTTALEPTAKIKPCNFITVQAVHKGYERYIARGKDK